LQINIFLLLVLIAGTFIIGKLFGFSVSGRWQRLILYSFLGGFLFYSGFGIAYPEVPGHYSYYYFTIVFVFAFFFMLFSNLLGGLSLKAERILMKPLNNVDHHSGWTAVIVIYLLTFLLTLIYPQFRIPLLFNPPVPDLTTPFLLRFEPQPTNLFLKLISYVQLSLEPFFYIALYRYRKSMVKVSFLLILVAYLTYVNAGYISRGSLFVVLAMIWLFYWESRPQFRRRLYFATAALVPFSLYASYVYGIIRLGGTVGNINPIEVSLETLELEMSFLRSVGVILIESGARVDFGEYAKWLFTLPIPKIFTGEIEAARINYEIARIVLGINPGARGWYIALSGLLAESIYIFGPYLFWLHAGFLAFFAAFLGGLVERTRQLFFLKIYILLLFAYVLNRGGIAAFMPLVGEEDSLAG